MLKAIKRYGSYRVIAKIEDMELIILALQLGHRQDIYSLKDSTGFCRRQMAGLQ